MPLKVIKGVWIDCRKKGKKKEDDNFLKRMTGGEREVKK